jgi:predicted CXXCH cytochrome family protein
MARQRTQKLVSKRIDLSYFKRPHALRTGRKAATWVIAVLAIAFVAWFSMGSSDFANNPGPLTSAHATWTNNCNACHDGGGQSGQPGAFSKAVSDAACLACHDGAMHHPNQLPATLAKWPAVATGKSEAGGKNEGGGEVLKAANCVSCHIEHRGHDLLVGTDSRLCISCHADLKLNAKNPPATASHVVAFNDPEHPHFGRSLRGGPESKPTDPTKLAFNHKVHNKIAVLTDNCIACHQTANVNVPVTPPAAGVAPPYATGEEQVISLGDKAGAEMLPVSFERNCIGCHPIEVASGGAAGVKLTVPHRELSEVRTFLAGLPTAYANTLAAMTPEQRAKELTVEIVTGRPPRMKKEKKTITEAEWLETKLKDLSTSMDKSFGSGDAKYTQLKKALTAPPTTAPSMTAPSMTASVGPDASLLEYYVTNGVAGKCVKCHEVQGEVPAMVFGKAAPATASSNLTLASTVRTGIGTTPRHWYASAKFDHNAHRSVECLSCHKAAQTSELTSDFLSPDFDTGMAEGTACVSCHGQPPVPSMASPKQQPMELSAGSNCITCHNFHSPNATRLPSGTINPKTGKPAPIVPAEESKTGPVAEAK